MKSKLPQLIEEIADKRLKNFSYWAVISLAVYISLSVGMIGGIILGHHMTIYQLTNSEKE